MPAGPIARALKGTFKEDQYRDLELAMFSNLVVCQCEHLDCYKREAGSGSLVFLSPVSKNKP